MLLRPGICNAIQVVQPKLEWSTLGGGLALHVETHSIGLLDIHSLSTSGGVIEETRDDDESDTEMMNCFFTMTSNTGDVYVFETTTPAEAERMVQGIKNIAARLTAELISGDSNALLDFYNNTGEADAIRFSPDEAMLRLSNAFFD